MAGTERRKKEIEKMKSSILDAAGHLFTEMGYEQTTLRKIARDIGYNQATIYNYYENKEEIFYALQERAFTHFYMAFNDLRESSVTGFKKLKIMGRRYINFALKNRQMYELMFIMRSPMKAADRIDPEWKIGEGNYNFLKIVIADCLKEESISLKDTESGAFMIWSMVHGIVSLVIMERTHMIPDEQLNAVMKRAYLNFEELLLKSANSST